MPNPTAYMLDAFAETMEKLALGNMGASAATLAAMGAPLSAYGGYEAARARGEDIPSSLLSAGKAGLLGGLGSAALGGGIAALHGGAGKSIADFGRRQLHGVSGYVPKGQAAESYARSIGIGGDTSKAVTQAKEFRAALERGQEPSAIYSPSRLLPTSWRQHLAERGVRSAEAGRKATETLLQRGATSLPGLAKALKGPQRGEVLRALGSEFHHGSGLLGKGLMGLGLYGDLTRQTDAEGNPIGRGERVGRVAGSLAAAALPSTLPLSVQMLAQPLVGAAAGAAGKLVDRGAQLVKPKVLGPTRDFTRPEESVAHLAGPEVTMTPSAAGKPYGAGMIQ